MLGMIRHDAREHYNDKLMLFEQRVREIFSLYREKEPSDVTYKHFSDMNVGDTFDLGGFQNEIIAKTDDEIEIKTRCKQGSRAGVHFHDFLEVISDKNDILIVTGNVKKILLNKDEVIYSIKPNVSHSIYVKRDGNITSYLKNPKNDTDEKKI